MSIFSSPPRDPKSKKKQPRVNQQFVSRTGRGVSKIVTNTPSRNGHDGGGRHTLSADKFDVRDMEEGFRILNSGDDE